MDDRCAWQVPGGHLVRVVLDGTETLCLKAQRQSKDYVNHYLLPLAPLPAGLRGMALVYVDPDTPLRAHDGGSVATNGEALANADVGDVVVTASGRFLKVFDTARADRHFCYVDLASGEVRQRQERAMTAAVAWRINFTQDAAD